MIEKARGLRREQTNAEKIFWRHVRNRSLGGLKFRRQAPIGMFVADFLIEGARLVIELDGDQHGLDEGLAHDAGRDEFLRKEGYEILRIWNREVYDNLAGVLDLVLDEANNRIRFLESADPSPETAAQFRPLPRER